ncbi:hypothetical protein N7E02_15760 [Aliirhizobium terrae]|uniref:hypothetical protein n=1 Tax=Terrirhizobium terrae TaxID=2926709 RepID=UPI00257544EF|nr:hypothetical protein [Rhizobium sp. CC-CFT758]WJH41729.1 hypothetical protein N7E02_15760 [Rhizobium sp. CC-CFT758]
MIKLPDPEGWLKRRAGRQRARSAFLHNSRKPRMTPEEARRDHSQMLRFLGLHAAVGALIGTAVGLSLIVLDIGGLGRLFARASNPAVPLILVIVPFASLFGGAATATAILTLPYDRKYRDEDEDQP